MKREKMNVLILEDENRAAQHLQRLLKGVDPGIRVLRVLDTVRDAVTFLKSPPDQLELIFSDVQLADGLCFEVFRRVEVRIPVIFTTAYDQYAIEAFNTSGIDYLLKPLEEERLHRALLKVRRFSPVPDIQKLIALSEGRPVNSYKARFLVKVGQQIKIIPVEQISAFYTSQKATFLLTSGQRNYPIDLSLDAVQAKVDPSEFFRISRKVIVSLEACSKVHAWSGNRLKLQIEGLEEDLRIVSRDRAPEFRKWLDR